MSTLSWNYRGLGTSWAIQLLKESVLKKKPRFVFLCETLCKQDIVKNTRVCLNFDGAFSVDALGHSGGIALLWRKDSEVQVMSYSKNHIDVKVDIVGWQNFRLTGIYGEPDRARREETWTLIRNLTNQSTLPWCLIGDMNNITQQEDKRGGRPYPQWLVTGFQKLLEECNLTDLELGGYRYTWERGKRTDNWIEVHLDRALVSNSFLQQFSDTKLTNLEIPTSDHNPIFMEPVSNIYEFSAKRFRFKNAWLREPMCHQIVKDV